MTLDEIITRHAPLDGALLPILHDVQSAFGYISEDAIRLIAAALNLTRAEVYGVVSFYHDFRQSHDPRPSLKLCRAEACQARGVEALVAALPDDHRVNIEAVYCLGLCAVGPAALIGHTVHARLDLEKTSALIASVL